LLGSEIAVVLSDILELSSGWVDDLDIGRQVAVTVDLAELVEGLVGDGRDVQLMVADGQQVVINVLENWVGQLSVWRSSIA